LRVTVQALCSLGRTVRGPMTSMWPRWSRRLSCLFVGGFAVARC
jgi:hypothetical protein